MRKTSISEIPVKYSSVDGVDVEYSRDLNCSTRSLIKIETCNKCTDNMNKYPLQSAAGEGNIKELKKLLYEKNEDILKYFKGRSALHYAAIHSNHKIGKECISIILNHARRVLEDDAEYLEFLNKADDLNGETALHLAAKNEAESSVEALIFAGADVQIKSKEGKQQLEIIFAKVPKAMKKVFNYGITWCKEEQDDDEFNDEDEDRKIIFDFGSLIGFPTDEETEIKDKEMNTRIWKKFPFETEILSKSLGSANSYETTLSHPLVKMFIHLKWKKIRGLFWLSQFIHALWLFLYTLYVVEVFILFCPYDPKNQTFLDYSIKKNEINEEISTMKVTTGFSWLGNPYNDTDFVECDLGGRKVLSVLTCINLTMTFLVFIKECYEMWKSPNILTYFTGLENIGQLALIIVQIITAFPWLVQSTLLYPWMYQFAALGIFLSWLLILCEVAKFPQLGVYCSMLLKVIKSYALFFVTFISLLIAFALSFSIIFPRRGGFVSIPVSFLKVIVMMAGEIEYMEVFHGDQGPVPFPLSGHIIFAAFTFMVTIILFNLLVGLTVNDIQGLQDSAEVLSLSSQLDNIQLLESFILSKHVQNFLMAFGKRNWLKAFLIIDPATPAIIEESLKVIIPLKEIPREFHKAVQKLASENCTSVSNMPESKTRPTSAQLNDDDEILMIKCRAILEEMIEIWERKDKKRENQTEKIDDENEGEKIIKNLNRN